MKVMKDRDERINEIRQAAEYLFTTKGYSKTTINDILKKVGIAKGTFYYYFNSKEEVMDAIIEHYIDMTISHAQSIVDQPSLSAQEKLFQVLMTQQIETNRKDHVIEELHQADNAEMHQKSLVATITKLTPVITTIVEQGIDEGVFHTYYPQETVEFLLVSSQFLFDEGIFQWEEEQLAKKAIAFVELVEKSLGAEQGSFSYLIQKLNNSKIKGDDVIE
ncbi:TetR/AcrR family transcriptional regulator [Gracilibacillus sp. HCP3S3_G5_1]|uniref:TetR/AcrR family transcriptional regulator n=1 Tax=unclassified Gracilibacillus TaxID=2625209 RepID=UPI003F898F27